LTAFFSLIWIFAIGQIGEYTMTTKLAVYWVYLAVMLNFWLTYILWKYLSNYFYVRSQEIENANKELKNMLK
jgi:type VI protein secretion system component VasK